MAKYPLPCLVTQDAFDLTPFGQWLLLQNAALQGDRLGPHLVVHRNTPERTLSVMERKCQCQRLCDAHGHTLGMYESIHWSEADLAKSSPP